MPTKNFFKRTITAVFFVLIILAALLLHHSLFGIVFLLFMLIALQETYKIIGTEGHKAQENYGLIAASVIFISSYLVAQGLAQTIIYFLIAPIFMGFFIIEIFKHDKKQYRSISKTVFGLVYVAVPFSMFNYLGTFELWKNDIHNYLLLAFFLILWANDTGAYIIGSLIGKNPFIKHISPKKTIEGTLGGIITATGTAALLSLLSPSVNMLSWIGLGIVISVSGTYGDLAESMMKRRAKVKDSGKIMPGHGGILDRFDSFIFAVPAVFTYIKILEIFN